jgi:hypothetical protein
MNIKRLLATAAMTAGLAIGLAATATAAPVSDDFWECAGEHPDDIGVCCVFYGRDYDEQSGICCIEEATAEEVKPQPPKVKPEMPVLTPASRLPLASLG